MNAATAKLRERGVRLIEAQDWDVPAYASFYNALGFRAARRYLFLAWDLTAPLPERAMNREVIVRSAVLADLDALADLYAQMYSPYWAWSREVGETQDEICEKYRTVFARRLGEAKSDRIYFAAVAGGQLVGGITARVDEELNRLKDVHDGSLNPGGVGVLPEFRRRKIAARLVYEALMYFRARGLTRTLVWTFSYLDADAPAVPLYVSCGASVVRRSLGWEKDVLL